LAGDDRFFGRILEELSARGVAITRADA